MKQNKQCFKTENSPQFRRSRVTTFEGTLAVHSCTLAGKQERDNGGFYRKTKMTLYSEPLLLARVKMITCIF